MVVSLVTPLHGTWLGAVLGHSILIPLWTLSPLFLAVPFIIAAMLYSGGAWAVCGIAVLAVFSGIMIIRLPYTPSLMHMFYNLKLSNYYKRCELRGLLHDGAFQRQIGHQREIGQRQPRVRRGVFAPVEPLLNRAPFVRVPVGGEYLANFQLWGGALCGCL